MHQGEQIYIFMSTKNSSLSDLGLTPRRVTWTMKYNFLQKNIACLYLSMDFRKKET